MDSFDDLKNPPSFFFPTIISKLYFISYPTILCSANLC